MGSGLGERLRGLFKTEPRVKVHLLIKGHIGHGFFSVDKTLKLPVGMTLNDLIAWAPERGIPLDEALDKSPHLKHTLMWNGERCPVAEHGERVIQDGDSIYLLAPLVGG